MSAKKVLLATVASSAMLLTAPISAVAGGHRTPHATTVNDDVVMPYSLAVARSGVFVADGGTRKVSRLRNGTLHTIATGLADGDVAGLDVSRNGRRLAYTTSNAKHTRTTLEILGPYGKHVTANLAAYEKLRNPDHRRHYGVDGKVETCVSEALNKAGVPVSYRGEVDSHPYAVASAGHHWFVADAGGNDILRVSRTGKISTVAVLPRQPLKVTADIAKALGLPGCVIGVTYNFESVPTDVEVGPHGWLYVSVLAGGPEDPSLGARSKVYRVNPRTGHATLVGSHLAGATDIALHRGRIFVAEFYAGRISVLRNGSPHNYLALPNALSLESGRGALWAGVAAPFGKPGATGKIVRIR